MRYLISVFFILFAFVANAQKDSLVVAQNKARNDSIYRNRFNQGNRHLGITPDLTFSVGGDDYKYRLYGISLEGGYFIKKKLLVFINEHPMYCYIKDTDEEGKYYCFNNQVASGFRYYLAARKWTVFGEGALFYSFENAKSVDDYSKPALTTHSLGASAGLGMTLCFNYFDFSLFYNYLFPLYKSNEPDAEYRWEFFNEGLKPGISITFNF